MMSYIKDFFNDKEVFKSTVISVGKFLFYLVFELGVAEVILTTLPEADTSSVYGVLIALGMIISKIEKKVIAK